MNTLVYGKNSSGKTSRIIIKEINKKISREESFVFLDCKEEYYNYYYKELKDKNYKICVVNLKDCLKSNTWNPLSYPYKFYKENKDKCIELLKELGTSIFQDETVEDKFWINACSDLFVGLSLILFEGAKEDAINLYSINKMVTNENIFLKILEHYEETDAIYLTLSEILIAPKETRESIFTMFKQNLNIYLIYENLSSLLSHNEFDLEQLKFNKSALFFINKEDKKNINNLADIYINQVYQYINDNRIMNKFNFVLDNIETIPNLTNLDNILSTGNSKNVDVIVGLRDLEWYKDLYSLRDIDVIYNLNNVDYIIKVEKESKRKYTLYDYPINEITNIADYPILQKHPKFLFNLEVYLNQKSNSN